MLETIKNEIKAQLEYKLFSTDTSNKCSVKQMVVLFIGCTLALM